MGFRVKDIGVPDWALKASLFGLWSFYSLGASKGLSGFGVLDC